MAAAPTWAQVSRKKKPPSFPPTECAVNLEQFTAPQRLPPSSSRYSTFIPLPSAYKQGWAMDIITKLPSSAVSMVPHADISLLEVCFANKEVQQDFLSSPFVCKYFTAHPVPPTGTPSTFVPIKLMNVPVLASLIVEQQLCNHWSKYGKVVAIAPHMFKGLPLQSNCWDMVLKVNTGSPLSANPLFEILRFKVMASWPGSEKVCPRCKTVGHDSHSCPRRPAPKKSKKRTSPPTQRTTPATPSSSSLIAKSATADAVDMEEDTPTSDPSLFPFELTVEQAHSLDKLTPEQWLIHCQNVRANHPRNELVIDNFLSRPIEEIVKVFRDAVKHLVSISPSPSDTSIPSSSSSAPPTPKPTPPLPAPLPTVDIPTYPYTFTDAQLDKCEHFSDAQFYAAARNFKQGAKSKNRAFYKEHSIEILAASLKQAVHSLRPPTQQS